MGVESSVRRDNVGARSIRTWLIAIALVILTVGYVSAFPQALLVIDSGRDIANAWSIATGEVFPLAGPGIYGTWSLGPVWYYLIALPFALGGSLTLLALWVGLIAACKIPLAYLLGRHWHGPAGGLLLAALIALPGWNSIGAVIIAHTSVIEAAVLASVLCSVLALDRPSTGRLLLAAIVFSLALHAHPTALVVAPWLCAAFVSRLRAGKAIVPVALGATVFLLPWLPMLVAEAIAGWPMLEATRTFAGEGDFLARSDSVAAATRGLLTGWAPLLSRYLVPSLAPVEAWLALTWFAALALAGAGQLLAIRRRPLLTLALIVNLLAALWLVCVLRPDAPVYMFYAVFPLAAWAALHGWHGVLPQRGLWICSAGLAIIAALLQLGVLLERNAVVARGTLPFPGEAVSDVRLPVRDDDWTRFWLPVSEQERAAQVLCGASTAAHGELAGALAWGANVAVERACAVGDRPRLGGRDARTHIAGMPTTHARQLAIVGHPLGSGFIASEPTGIFHPPYGAPATVDPEYVVEAYRRRIAEAGMQSIELHADCPAGNVLVVNNLMPGLNQIDIAVQRDGHVLTSSLTTIAASYYRCDDGAELHISGAALNLQAVDIFTLETESGG
jgi:hypothetical protein